MTRLISLLLSAIFGLTSTAARSDPTPPGPQFEPSGWNEITRDNADGTKTTAFYQGFVNYADAQGSWKAIRVVPVASDTHFTITEAPYTLELPKRSTGPMRFVSTNRYSVTEKTMRDDAPLGKDRTYPAIADVPGIVTDEGVLYEGAFPDINADLLVQPHQDGVRWLIRWDSAPQCTGDMEVRFREDFDGGEIKNGDKELKGTEERLTDYRAEVNDFRGIWTGKSPSIWDSAHNRSAVELRGRVSQGKVHLRKLIPCAFFTADTVYPVYSDDTTAFTPSEGDGVVSINNQGSWAAAHDAADGDGLTDTGTSNRTPYVDHEISPTRISIGRTFAVVNTSALDDTAVISAVTYSLYVSAKGNGDNDGQDYVNVYGNTQANDASLALADFDQAGTTAYATAIDIGDITTGAMNTWTFNATGIAAVSKTGNTKLSLREGHDAENAALASNTSNSITVNMAENVANKPSLSVTWSLPATRVYQPVIF